MKEKIAPWDVFEVLTTENRIKLYIEASIEEARNDTDPRYLTRALATAAEARRRIAQKQNTAEVSREIAFDETAIGEFDKTARLFGYHITLTPVA